VCGAHMMGGASDAISRGGIAIVAAIVPVPLVLAGGADAQVVIMVGTRGIQCLCVELTALCDGCGSL
jgi:hypothetical protein